MMTEDEIQKIIRLHGSGMPLHEIAEECGVALVTIKRRISEIRKTHDLPWRSKSKQKTNEMRENKDAEETPWNLDLGHKYITAEWRP